jgi:hypothetical protein
MTTDSATADSERRPRLRRFRAAAIVFAAIATLLVAIVILTGARRLQPDEIVREIGAYNSPGNRLRVVVAESDQKTVTFTLVSPKSWKRVTNLLHHGRPMPVVECEVERDWFFCFDQHDRLWVFVGRWDKSWGPLRQIPGGGTRPRTQSIVMSGFWVDRGIFVSGANIVSTTGDWPGVPQRFFEEIPGRDDSTLWGDGLTLPQSPPEFSPVERQVISAARSFGAAHWRGPESQQ